MDPSTSESDQDGGTTSAEDNSFERPNASSDVDGGGGQCPEQNRQLPYGTATTADSYLGAVISSSYLPFMMQPSYQLAAHGSAGPLAMTAGPQAAANAAFYFSQNPSLTKDSDVLGGSPLNLQLAGRQADLPSIGSGHGNFNGGAVPQPRPQHGIPPASPSPGLQHARASPHVMAGSPYASPSSVHQPASATYMANPNLGRFPEDGLYRKADSGAAKPTEYPPPPKKPLTPYMRFNKFMWEKVKATNSSMGVCEISATIGRLWRELGPEDKQRHNDEYTMDKARYDEELKVYLKTTGLRSSDLVKQKPKKSKPSSSSAQQRRSAAPPPVSIPPAVSVPAAREHQPHQQTQQHASQQQQQQQLQALMGLPGSLPIGMPVSFQNMAMLGGFPQMWAAAGQQYAGGLPLHEFYGGGVNGVDGPPPAHSQQPSQSASSPDMQPSALYRYPQGFM